MLVPLFDIVGCTRVTFEVLLAAVSVLEAPAVPAVPGEGAGGAGVGRSLGLGGLVGLVGGSAVALRWEFDPFVPTVGAVRR